MPVAPPTNAPDTTEPSELEPSELETRTAALESLLRTPTHPHSDIPRIVWRARTLALITTNSWLRRLPFVSPTATTAELDALARAWPGGEYCWSPSRDPALIARLSYAGYLSIGLPLEAAEARGVLAATEDSVREAVALLGGDEHVALVTVARLVAADPCVDGRESVLLPNLHLERCVMPLATLRAAKSVRRRARALQFSMDTCFEAVADGCIAQHGVNWLGYVRDSLVHLHHHPEPQARAHSIEVWENGELVAGEVGVVVGAIYTR